MFLFVDDRYAGWLVAKTLEPADAEQDIYGWGKITEGESFPRFLHVPYWRKPICKLVLWYKARFTSVVNHVGHVACCQFSCHGED